MISFRAITVIIVAVTAPVWAQTLPATQPSVTVKVDRASGVYDAGENVRWTVSGDLANAVYTVRHAGGSKIAQGSLDLSKGPRNVDSGSTTPGSLLLTVETPGGDARFLGGAVVAPFRIAPTDAAPADFDAFWNAKLGELAAVPLRPRVTPGQSDDTSDYFLVQLDNIRGRKIHGQLARPRKPGKYPALLILPWAGVYGLPKSNVTGRADQGWLALNIMAHDLPSDRPKEFYEKADKSTHKGYVRLDNDDREKSYFLPMYLGCYRATEYLATRDDWDGKTLVVMGTSQGGQLSLVTAGLHPKVTAVLAHVPGGCDVAGLEIGRTGGFPRWAEAARSSNNPAIAQTGRYFDTVHFAERIKCPALVSAGLLDASCPPTGVLAAFNQITSPKESVIMPESEHKNVRNSQKSYYDREKVWLDALVNGQVPPAP